MIHTTLDQIDALLSKSTLSTAQKKQLEACYQQLRTELATLAKTNPDKANSLADYAKIATTEALRDNSNLDLVKRSQQELRHALDSFEGSHPRLCATLQTLLVHLSSLGI